MKKSLVAILLTVLITLTGCGLELGYQGTGVAKSEFNINNYADEIVDDLRELSESQNRELGKGTVGIELGYNYEYNEESENPYIETLHVRMVEEADEDGVCYTYFIYYDVTTEGLIMKYAF